LKKEFKTTQRTSPLKTDGTRPPASALVVIRGEPIGKCYEIRHAPLTVGRDSSCDIQFEEHSVSRRHCQIWRGTDGVYIRDLGATNPTLVNEEAVDEVLLADGDRVTLGHRVLKFIDQWIEAEYHSELFLRASIDPLTQLANRRTLDHALSRAINQSHQELSLIIVDIDHFKQINDRHDHVVGDRILKDVAQMLEAQLDETGLAARMGGEEFALLLHGADINAAEACAENVRKAIDSHSFVGNNNPVKVTVSAGVAQWQTWMNHPKALVRAADQALLEAKRDGRNRVKRAVY
jgi:diguanylate cyclase (GGDEF)-like protein